MREREAEEGLDSGVLVLDLITAPAMAVAVARKAQKDPLADEVDLAGGLDLAATAYGEWDDPLADERDGEAWLRHIVCEKTSVLQSAVLNGGRLEDRVEGIGCGVEGKAFET